MSDTEGASVLVYLLLDESEKQRRNRVVPRKRRAVMRRRRFHEKQARERAIFAVFMSMAICGLFTSSTRTMWTKTRSTDWWENVVNNDDFNWNENFHMSRQTFDYLCTELKCQDTIMRKAIPLNKRVGIALWYMATNMDFRSLGHLFGVSKSTVCHIIKEVCAAIRYVLLPKYIKVPSGEALQHVMSGFKRRLGFPQCAGAVDGTHSYSGTTRMSS